MSDGQLEFEVLARISGQVYAEVQNLARTIKQTVERHATPEAKKVIGPALDKIVDQVGKAAREMGDVLEDQFLKSGRDGGRAFTRGLETVDLSTLADAIRRDMSQVDNALEAAVRDVKRMGDVLEDTGSRPLGKSFAKSIEGAARARSDDLSGFMRWMQTQEEGYKRLARMVIAFTDQEQKERNRRTRAAGIESEGFNQTARERIVAMQREAAAERNASRERIVATQASEARRNAIIKTGLNTSLVAFRNFASVSRSAITSGLDIVHRAFTTTFSGIGDIVHRAFSRSNEAAEAGMRGITTSTESGMRRFRTTTNTYLDASTNDWRQYTTTVGRMQAMNQQGIAGLLTGQSALGQGLRSLAFIGGGALTLTGFFTAGSQTAEGLNVLQTMLDATAEEMETVRQAAVDLGNDITLPGVSARDAADAMSHMAQAGFSLEDSMTAAKGVLQLSRGALVDAGEAARLTATFINAFNLEADKATAVADTLAAALKFGGGTTFSEISSAASQASAVFSQFQGATLGAEGAMRQMTAAIAILGREGLRGSDAGTSLRTMMLRLASPTDQARSLMESLAQNIGITGDLAYDAQGNMRPFTEILQNVRLALAGMNEEARNQTLTDLFGPDAIRAAMAFVTTSQEAFDQVVAGLDDVGFAAELAAARNKGLKGALDATMSTLETLAIQIYDKVEVPLGNALLAILGFFNAIKEGEGVWEIIRNGLLGIGAALAVAVGVHALGEAFRFLRVAIMGVWTAFGPLGLAALAASAGLMILWKSSDRFREAVTGALGAVRGAWDDLVEGFRAPSTEVDNVFERLGARVRGVVDDVTGAWADLREGFNAPFSERDNAFERFGSSIAVTWERIKGVFDTIRENLAGLGDEVRKHWGRFMLGFNVGVAYGVWGEIGKRVGALRDAVGEAIPKIVGWFGDLFGAIRSGLTGGSQLSGFFGFVEGVARAVGLLGSAVGSIVSGIVDAIGALVRADFGGVWDALRGAFTGAGAKVAEALSPVWDAIVGFITSIPGRISDAFGGLTVGDIARGIFRLFNKIGEIIGEVAGSKVFLGALAGVAGVLLDALVGLITGVVEGLARSDIGTVITRGLGEVLKEGVQGLLDPGRLAQILGVGLLIGALVRVLRQNFTRAFADAGASVGREAGAGFFRQFASGFRTVRMTGSALAGTMSDIAGTVHRTAVRALDRTFGVRSSYAGVARTFSMSLSSAFGAARYNVPPLVGTQLQQSLTEQMTRGVMGAFRGTSAIIGGFVGRLSGQLARGFDTTLSRVFPAFTDQFGTMTSKAQAANSALVGLGTALGTFASIQIPGAAGAVATLGTALGGIAAGAAAGGVWGAAIAGFGALVGAVFGRAAASARQLEEDLKEMAEAARQGMDPIEEFVDQIAQGTAVNTDWSLNIQQALAETGGSLLEFEGNLQDVTATIRREFESGADFIAAWDEGWRFVGDDVTRVWREVGGNMDDFTAKLQEQFSVSAEGAKALGVAVSELGPDFIEQLSPRELSDLWDRVALSIDRIDLQETVGATEVLRDGTERVNDELSITEDQIRSVTAFADQAAAAIHNVLFPEDMGRLDESIRGTLSTAQQFVSLIGEATLTDTVLDPQGALDFRNNLEGSRQAFSTMLGDLASGGATFEEMNVAVGDVRSQFETLLTTSGLTADEAKRIADEIFRIPPSTEWELFIKASEQGIDFEVVQGWITNGIQIPVILELLSEGVATAFVAGFKVPISVDIPQSIENFETWREYIDDRLLKSELRMPVDADVERARDSISAERRSVERTESRVPIGANTAVFDRVMAGVRATKATVTATISGNDSPVKATVEALKRSRNEMFMTLKGDFVELDRQIRSYRPVVQVTFKGGKLPGQAASGAVVTRESLWLLGEGNRAEVVIPLTNFARALQLLRQTGLDRLILEDARGDFQSFMRSARAIQSMRPGTAVAGTTTIEKSAMVTQQNTFVMPTADPETIGMHVGNATRRAVRRARL